MQSLLFSSPVRSQKREKRLCSQGGEKDDNFDNFIDNADVCANALQWVDIAGNPASVSSEWTGNDRLGQKARR